MGRNHFSAIGIGFFLLLLLMSGGCGGGEKEQGPKQGSLRKPDYSMTAKDLTREFIADAEMARIKYADKLVEIIGEVNSVVMFEGVKTGVQFVGELNKGDFQALLVYAMPSAEAMEKAIGFSRKQKVKATGEFEAFFSSSIFLNRCTFEELNGSEAIQISAQDLAAEFAKDRNAANKKYNDKDVLLTGEVEEVKQEKEFGLYLVKLNGGDKRKVSVTLGPEDLKAGQTARFRVELLQVSPSVTDQEISMGLAKLVRTK